MFECDEADEVTWEVRLTGVNRSRPWFTGLARDTIGDVFQTLCVPFILVTIHSYHLSCVATFVSSASSSVDVHQLGCERPTFTSTEVISFPALQFRRDW